VDAAGHENVKTLLAVINYKMAVVELITTSKLYIDGQGKNRL